jgi:primosomal protein N' (replication factor Y)
MVRGWVVDDGAHPPPGVEIRDVSEVSSLGPTPSVVGLCRWAVWRYAGKLRPFLLAGSPAKQVRELPVPARAQHRDFRQSAVTSSQVAPTRGENFAEDAVAAALVDTGITRPVAVLRLAPASGRLALVQRAAELARAQGRDALVIVPTRSEAARLVSLLRGSGRRAALLPEEWAAAAAGDAIVVGTRNAAFAPAPLPGVLVVLDAHAEQLTETRAPTWNGAVVAAERARGLGVPCLLVSPCPTLELLAAGELIAPSRASERRGWAPLEIVDRRDEDPRSGLYGERAVLLARAAVAAEGGRPVVFVLSRTGTARAVRCAACSSVVRCETCGTAMGKGMSPRSQAQVQAAAQVRVDTDKRSAAPPTPELLTCPRGCEPQPPICTECGSRRLKLLAIGTKRAATDLQALLGIPVAEVTAEENRRSTARLGADVRAVMGTEAALHRVSSAALVVFLDFDLELTSPRLRAEEHALALLALASRIVGGRRRDGRVLVQTRIPDHEVLAAAVGADPSIVSEPEQARREHLRLPPFYAVAIITGEESARLAEHLETEHGVEVSETDRGYLVRARSEQLLCDALAASRHLGADARVEVDPLRL